MMETEAAVDKAADATATATDSQPIITDAQNVDDQTVNGTVSNSNSSSTDDIANKHITNVEDQITSTDVSVSGGSDTEASRTDKSKDGGHGRTGSSVKKPATFKAVSVNKTFLAAKAASASAASKASEKPAAGSSTPPTSSATLSSRPRLVAKTGSGAGGNVPRLSGVNGGKPAAAPDPNVVWNKNRPAPPPEPKKFTDEELKKYGIHMASRLNEDDAQGQNKWADIDDDDDDWAPEAITWGDGTKTTLPHPDEQPAPPPPLPPAPPTDTGSTNSKIVRTLEKPRSPAPVSATSSPLPKTSGLASGKGLVLKSGSSQEKPTLVAKPTVPTPVKSPWAALPPVDRASPVDTGLNQRGNVTDTSPLKTMTSPPKEIAADDFNRSTWRESNGHGNRELYNSQSGRYEPVQDRRGSMRQDQHPRGNPALLQRPSGPEYPEPSSAFQTSRNAPEMPFGRRRGSSNVSGGSGQYYQRLGKGPEGSMPPPPEHLGTRRPSYAGSMEGPISPNMPYHPHGHGPSRQPPAAGGNWMPRASPRGNYATPHPGGLPSEGAMGPPPLPPQPLQTAAPAVDEIEYQKKLMREKTELARKRRQEQEAREEAERKARIQKKLEALGPAPEKRSDKKEAPKNDGSKPTQIQQREAPQPGQFSPEEKNPATASDTPEAADGQPKTSPHAGKNVGPRRASHSQEQKPTDLWTVAASRPDRFSTWAAGVQQAPRNVWGSPNNDRGLGNGTFNPDLGRIHGGNVAATPGGGKAPAPIAPPNAAQVPPQGRQQPQPQQQQQQQPVSIGSRASRYGAPASELANKWVSAVAESDQKLAAEQLAERTERERQLAERGMTVEDAQPVIKDTWRPVHLPGDGTRQAVGRTETQSHQPGAWGPAGEEARQADELNARSPGVIGAGSGSVLPSGRTSRFFPTRDIRGESGYPADHARSKSPTPPPPTMEGHPAYEGDVMRPHVSLPKPQPRVRLPPSMTGLPASQPRPQFGKAPPMAYKDVVRAPPPSQPSNPAQAASGQSQGNWQDKINNLLNPVKSPQNRSIGVESSSKSALDYAAQHDGATVSLPGVDMSQSAARPRGGAATKPMAEECFEEQEMGSLPQIRVPHKAPEAAWQPAPVPKHLPKKFMIEPGMRTPYYFSAEVNGGGNAMKIQFPGMSEPRFVTVPFSATRGGRGLSSRSGTRPRGSGSERRGGKRDTSSTRGDQSSSTSGRGGRGGYRSRGNGSWHRQSATPT